MGPQEDYVETVFTCEGDINDPNLQTRLEDFKQGLRDLLSTDKRKLILKKVEPWNSVRVTFKIPLEAARRLKQLAQQGNESLRQLGVLAVQLEGDQLISLTIAGRNNERTQLIFRTTGDAADAASVTVVNSSAQGPDRGTRTYNQQRPGTIDNAQSNIAQYIRQGTALFDSILQSRNAELSGDSTRVPQNNSVSPTRTTSQNIMPSESVGDFLPSVSGSHGNRRLPGIDVDPSGFPQIEGMLKSQMGLPPPPPYPGGSALLNNFAKAGMASSTASPLLVNLLQTDPHLAGIANFVNSKMLPPSETSPPPKKKRRPRKPKDKNKQAQGDGEIPIHSVPNPVHGSYNVCLPLVTSGSSSSMPSIPMVTQALPASSQPSVTYSSQGKNAFPSVSGMVHSDPNKMAGYQYQRSEDRVDQRLPENTAGKIINPYTGLLEPMDSSDSSPSKSDTSVDGYSPLKNMFKRSPKEQNLNKSAFSMNTSLSRSLDKGQLQNPAVFSSSNQYLTSSPSSLHLEQSSTSLSSTGALNSGSGSLERKTHSSFEHNSGSLVSRTEDISILRHNSAPVYSSECMNPTPVSEKASLPLSTSSTYLTSESNPHVSTSSAQNSSATSLHQQTLRHVSTVTTSHTVSDLPDHPCQGGSPDYLLNEPNHNPAKTVSGSPIIRSPDSENSSQSSLLPDQGMQSDNGAVVHGTTLESKVYNHDSGVGSSSERSDDTPSEPGDPDFKSGQPEDNLRLAENLSKEIIPKIDTSLKSLSETEVINAVHKNGKPGSISANLQNFVSKQNMDITVGYAMSNSVGAKTCDSNSMMDINSLLVNEKELSDHPFLKKLGRKSPHHNSTMLNRHGIDKMGMRNNDISRASGQNDVQREILQKDENLHPKDFEAVQSSPATTSPFSTAASEYSSHHSVRNSNKLSPFSYSSSRTPSPRLPGGLGTEPLTNSKDGRCNNDLFARTMSMPISSESQFLSHMKYSKSHSDGKSKSPTLTVVAAPVMKKVPELSLAQERVLHSNQGISEKTNHNVGTNVKSENGSRFSTFSVANGPVETSKTVDVTSMYRRKSPVSGLVNSVPHNFFDPSLPLARRLTESVQKLVKPFLATESSALPHSQRKSPVSSSKLSTSSPPRPSKGNGTKSSNSDSLLDKHGIMSFSDTMITGQNVSNSDIPNYLNLTSDPLSSHGIEGTVLSSLSHNAELPLLQLDNTQGLDFGIPPLITNHVSEGSSKAEAKCASESRSQFLGSLLKQTGLQRDSSESGKTPPLKESSSMINSRSNHTDTANQSKTSSLQSSFSSSTLIDPLRNSDQSVPLEDSKGGGAPLSSIKNVQQIAPLKIKLTDKKLSESEKCNLSNVSSLPEGKLLELHCPVCKSLQCECNDREVVRHSKTSKHNDLKSPPLRSPTSTDDTIKNALEVIEKSKKELEERKVEVTVVTKPKLTGDQKSDKSEPTVPPLILRVRRKSITETQDSAEESQSKMTLRTNRGSNKVEGTESMASQHSQRQQKIVKAQPDTAEKGEKCLQGEKEVNKASLEDDSSKRNLRKRKNPSLELDAEGKKPNMDGEDTARQTRSSEIKDNCNDSDVKVLKSENSAALTVQKLGDKTQNEVLENDTSKSNLRNREKSKPAVTEEKVKTVNSRDVKDLKRAKSTEEEDRGKRQLSRRNKPSIPPQPDKNQKTSPQLNDKTPGNVILENTVTGDALNKRSTRSAKTKDATDTLPPSNKRRRTSKDTR